MQHTYVLLRCVSEWLVRWLDGQEWPSQLCIWYKKFVQTMLKIIQ